MLSKNKIKFFNSLKLRKFRIKHNLFIAEGKKSVSELLKSEIKPKFIISVNKNINLPKNNNEFEFIETNYSDIKKISFLKTAPEIIGVFEIPKYDTDLKTISESLSLYLDGLQNPGNLGTVIRTADWFGIKNIFCSKDTADVYNPKTVQATAGAVASVKVHYTGKDFFKNLPPDLPVYGTFLNGSNIYETKLSRKGIIVIGNEGNGISETIAGYIKTRLYIPRFNESETGESLNASVAAAIIVSEFKRRLLY
ncbi:MAG: RNA methyltransferase [Chlorobi bacterium]|nr:RNA methyltransferase [Chlorobiota bacterium]